MGAEKPQSEILRSALVPHRSTRIEDPASVSVVASHETVVAGGGPAGLPAAFELGKYAKAGRAVPERISVAAGVRFEHARSRCLDR
jgi:heterodisulfide reductase subunit A-like polyferredoxin